MVSIKPAERVMMAGSRSFRLPANRRFRVRNFPGWPLAALFAACLFGADDVPRLQRLTTDGAFKQRPAWSPDDRHVCFARHAGSRIFLTLLDTSTVQASERRLTNRDTPEYDASWSPDGKRLVFCGVAQTPGQGNVDLCIVAADQPESKHLIGDNGKLSHEESPAWSPDGRQIAFTSTRDGNQEIYLIDTAGQNLKRLTQDPALDAHPMWTPDGQSLLFATNRWGDLEIARVNIADLNVERLTTSPGLDDYPVCSPDGKRIAYLSNRKRQYEIFVMPIAGGDSSNISQHPGQDNFPAWTSKGDLSWISDRDDGFDLYLLPAAALK